MVFTSIISLLYVLLDSVGWVESEVAIVVEDIALGCQVLGWVSRYKEGSEMGQGILSVSQSMRLNNASLTPRPRLTLVQRQ